MDIDEIKLDFNLQKTLGLILLAPPLLSVLFFFISVLFSYNVLPSGIRHIVRLDNLSSSWSGGIDYARDSGGGGYTSAAPIYLGLMAIAGALLLKDSDKK